MIFCPLKIKNLKIIFFYKLGKKFCLSKIYVPSKKKNENLWIKFQKTNKFLFLNLAPSEFNKK